MLILLDIDGVMVSACSWKAPELLNDGFPAFTKKASEALQRIINETDADILLTTSHKEKHSISEWYDIFNLRGLKVNKIDCLPENVNHSSRKDEIINWYQGNKIHESFVIIDDDKSLNTLPNNIKIKVIQTSPMIGLTNEYVSNAIAILQKEEIFDLV